ncbi:MAG: hypothetical protein AAGJ46_18850 [Planctomycetota bacterium]
MSKARTTVGSFVVVVRIVSFSATCFPDFRADFFAKLWLAIDEARRESIEDTAR